MNDTLDIIKLFPFAEIEEVPDPGRSPEAPGGAGYPGTGDDDDTSDEDDDDWDDSEETKPGTEGEFTFPEKKDPMM